MALAITLLSCALTTVLAETVLVQTPSGPIKGIKALAPETQDNVFKFFKIPFAKPPTGSLRFSKPETIDPWTDTLDATDDIPRMCHQIQTPLLAKYQPKGASMSEDCLLLNIIVPKLLSKPGTFPVMVYIHGGGFTFGSALDGSYIAARGDVIFVAIQYRLHMLGFFSVDDTYIKGNYALWDQKMALSWIQDNIASFGGDPNSVTIFGESAGGISVHMQSLIPSNEGLFHRVIAQSGCSSFVSIGTRSPQDLIDAVAKKTQCEFKNDPAKFVECLRNVSVETLTNNFGMWPLMEAPLTPYMAYKPVIDGELFKDYPNDLLQDQSSDVSKFYRSLDFLTGVTSAEGSMTYIGYSMVPGLEERYNFNIYDKLPVSLLCNGIATDIAKVFFGGNKDVSKAICEHYTLHGEDADAQSMRTTDTMADTVFRVPAINAINLHSLNNNDKKSYLYQLSRSPAVPFGPPPPAWFKGVGHGNDAVYLFMAVLDDEQLKEKDMDYANIFIHYWTSFAKTGDPNSENTPIVWPQYNPDTKKYLDLGTIPTVEENLSPDDVKFWLEDIPSIYKQTKEEL